MLWLHENDTSFPNYDSISEEGIVALGGKISTTLLIEAYKKGVFPWYGPNDPITWWCPNPRFVLFPNKLVVSKSMQRLFTQNAFYVTEDTEFNAIINMCASVRRKNQSGTWIQPEMVENYTLLHKIGMAKSIEVWNHKNKLVGGFYGVDIGNGTFSGESMFSKESNASKYGFIAFVKKYSSTYKLIDCQVYTQHLKSLGAENMSREEFLKYL